MKKYDVVYEDAWGDMCTVTVTARNEAMAIKVAEEIEPETAGCVLEVQDNG